MKLTTNEKLVEQAKQHVRSLTFGQIVVGVCVLGLSAYCMYNVYYILDKYYHHETIISLQNDPPNRTDFPGITICAPTLFTPKKLAELNPEFREKLLKFATETINSLRNNETIPKYSDPEMADPVSRNRLFRKYESIEIEKHSVVYILKTHSVQASELLSECNYNPINIRNYQPNNDKTNRPGSRICDDTKPLLESIYEGKKCFTYYSANNHENMDTNQSNEKSEVENEFKEFLQETENKMVFDLNPNIEVHIKSLENDIWTNFVGKEGILMTVHPPNIMQNRRDFLFITVLQHNYLEIAFTRKTTYLLPPPHRTMCVEYREDAHFANKAIKTRDQCISVCINKYTRKFADCANYYSVITESMFDFSNIKQKMCPHERQSYSEYLEARTSCEKECPEECEKIIFEISRQTRNTLNDSCSCWSDHFNYQDYNHSAAPLDVKQSSLRRCTSPVSIRISPKPFTTVRHQQAITYETFLGTIGGHIGIWLGLSLYKIIKLVVHILYNFLHKLVKKFSPKSSISTNKRVQ